LNLQRYKFRTILKIGKIKIKVKILLNFYVFSIFLGWIMKNAFVSFGIKLSDLHQAIF
jgi:hypothetical protein